RDPSSDGRFRAAESFSATRRPALALPVDVYAVPSGGKNDAVLAQSFCHQRRKSPRSDHDARAEPDAAVALALAFQRVVAGYASGPGDAQMAGRLGKPSRRPQREPGP